MQDSKTILIAILGAVLIGGVGFYGGTLYQKGKSSIGFNSRMMGANFGRSGNGDARDGRTGSGGTLGSMANRAGFRPIVGEILSKDDKSITVKLQDGSSKIVLLAQSTVINKAEKVDASALIVGDSVRVFGTTNSDGSVTAQDVQLE